MRVESYMGGLPSNFGFVIVRGRGDNESWLTLTGSWTKTKPWKAVRFDTIEEAEATIKNLKSNKQQERQEAKEGKV